MVVSIAYASEGTVSNADIADFIGDNHFVSRLDADINGDNVTDTIIVTANDDAILFKVSVLEGVRGKVIGSDGDEKTAFKNLDSMELELSPLGPPALSIKKGVLIIDHDCGGTTVRTVTTYRYRFDREQDAMRLIGIDSERVGGSSAVNISWNLLNGARIIKHGQMRSYGPGTRDIHKVGFIKMSQTRAPDDIIDEAIGDNTPP